MPQPLTIIARKPKSMHPDDRAMGLDYVVIDRGSAFEFANRYVSATITHASETNGEWFWGHYFATQDRALEHFNNR